MERNSLKSEYFKKYYDNNLDKIKATKRRYSADNADKLNRQTRQWHKDNPEKSLLVSAKGRARRARLPFNLSIEDIVFPDKCPVLGIDLKIKEGRRTDNTPSLDRLVPSKGYVKGNVRIISWRANRLKSDASLSELKQLVAYLEEF